MDTQTANSLAHPLDVPAAIAKRRSMKSFKPDAIEPALLRRLIELTVSAPSSWNLQDWRIVMIQDEAQKAALSEAAWGQKQIVQAPVTFVFAADLTVGEKDLSPIHQQALQNGALNQEAVNYLKTAIPDFQSKLGDRSREYAIKDATIAATHLVLAAESFGLSSCFMNGWAEEKVKAVIGATDNVDLAIAVLVPIGYGAEERLNPGRLPLASNVFIDRIDNPYQS
jgi:nitroreductase